MQGKCKASANSHANAVTAVTTLSPYSNVDVHNPIIVITMIRKTQRSDFVLQMLTTKPPRDPDAIYRE